MDYEKEQERLFEEASTEEYNDEEASEEEDNLEGRRNDSDTDQEFNEPRLY